jgi:FAD-dependent oxidoreductase domain-containing protein 1
MPEFIVIGGGVIGSSIAYFLADAGLADQVVVIEPDPTYEKAATPLSVGTVRRVHGLEENILMSEFGHDFYLNFARHMVVGDDAPTVSFRQQGYVFMVWGRDAVANLEVSWRLQRELGAPIDLLDRNALKVRLPSLNVADVDAALFSPQDGWIDPYSALMGFRRKAISLGVRYIKDRVTEFVTDRRRINQIVLESGDRIPAGIVVNAANCWAPELCARLGMPVPIEPMRRQTFYFDCKAELEPFPVTRDLNGLSFRPEGGGYIAGLTHLDEPGGFNWDLDYDWFDEAVWPRLAHRVSAFEEIKVMNGWSGHYDQNRLDSQPIIGPRVGGLDNFYLVAGFSGHGLQHAPAIGRAIKELLVDGEYLSIDLARFSYQRVLDNAPLEEIGPPA